MEKINCNSCNKKILAGVRFCPFCGAEQKVKKSSSAYNKNPFEVLQVTSKAEEEVIKAAYQSLAKKYHPDMLKNGTSEERMKELNWAYEEISDPEKRKKWISEDVFTTSEKESASTPKDKQVYTSKPKTPKMESEDWDTKEKKPPAKSKQTSSTTFTTPPSVPLKKKKSTGLYIFIAIAGFCIICLGIFGLGGVISILSGSDDYFRTPTAIVKKPTRTPKSTPISNQDFDTIFYDQFNSNTNGWDTSENDHEYGMTRSVIRDGRLIWSGEAYSNQDGFQTWRWPDIDQFSDFRVNVDVQKITGKINTSNHGITFRANDLGGYSFLVSDDYFALFALNMDGKDITLIDWTYNSNIHLTEQNKLSVLALDESIELFINNKSVAVIEDNKYSSGFIGLEFGIYEPGAKATVEFDNMSIWIPVETKIEDNSQTKKIGSIELCESDAQNDYCVYTIGFLEDTPRITIKHLITASSNVNLQVNGEIYICGTSSEFTGNLICWGEVFPNPKNASVSIISKDNNEVLAEGVLDLPSW